MTGLRTEFPDAEDSPGLMLWRVTHRWQSVMRQTLRPYGLTHVQFVLLATVAWLPSTRPVNQRDIAEHAHTDLMMTSQVLRALETKKLITRTTHPGDARARSITITPEGVRLANRANKAVEAADKKFFAHLGENTPRFTTALKTLVQNNF